MTRRQISICSSDLSVRVNSHLTVKNYATRSLTRSHNTPLLLTHVFKIHSGSIFHTLEVRTIKLELNCFIVLQRSLNIRRVSSQAEACVWNKKSVKTNCLCEWDSIYVNDILKLDGAWCELILSRLPRLEWCISSYIIMILLFKYFPKLLFFFFLIWNSDGNHSAVFSRVL